MGERKVDSEKSRRAVFLDRDGVLIKAIVRSGRPYPASCLSEVAIIPEVYPGLTALAAAGFLLIVVTNQPDVARGTQSRQEVEAIHEFLLKNLPLDQILVCYHDSIDQCNCRKPAPGLLLDAARMHGLNLEESYMVGDRWRDIEAGQRAGCKTIFIQYDYQERQPDSPTYSVRSFPEAVDIILAEKCEERQ